MFKLLEIERGKFINPRHVTSVCQKKNSQITVTLINGLRLETYGMAWEAVEQIEKEANKSYEKKD